MATFAIVTLPLTGHIRPMMAAARALRSAGHRPVVVGPIDLIQRIPSDIETFAIGERDLPVGQLDQLCTCLTRMTSFADMRQMYRTIATLSRLYMNHLPDAVMKLGADGIIHDQLEPAAGIVARGFSEGDRTFRHVSLACALPMNRDVYVPPPIMGWAYRDSGYGAWLNAGYYRVVNWLLREQGAVLAEGAAQFGLSKPDDLPDWQQPWSVDDGLSRTADLAQGLACLDYPRAKPPVYLGPLRDDQSPYPGLSSIAHERNGRPLCFVSLGSLMGGRTKVLSAMARAATDRGFQPVVVHGGRLDEITANLPKETITRDFLDQRDILSDSAAAMIHGGYNSTTDAVAAGVPLVTVPLAFEQGAIAARVERAGLGRKVSAVGPNLSQRIHLALGDVLGSADMAQASRRAQYEAMAAHGLQGFVVAIEGAAPQASLTGAILTPTVPQRPSMLPAE
ncbi:MAG: glycosyltransferase [Pseudomonadota bacterium]